MMMKLGWKAVTFMDDGRYTGSVIHAPRKGGVIYRVGEGVRPRPGCGPLMVSKTAKWALELIYYERGAVFLCAYIPSKRRTLETPELQCTKEIQQNPVDDLADEVMLIEEVKA